MDNLKKKDTKLIDAIATNNISRVKKLINQEINVNQFDIANDNFTPLMLAINLELTDIVRILIKAGANLQDSTYFEDTPLGLAITKGNLEIVELLLKAGAEPNDGGESSTLCYAAPIKHINLVKTLIKWGADPNSTTSSGITALMIAAISGNLEIVKILVEEGADVNATTHDSADVALNKAAYNGNQEIFDYLYYMTTNLDCRKYAEEQLAKAITRNDRKRKYGGLK